MKGLLSYNYWTPPLTEKEWQATATKMPTDLGRDLNKIC